MAKGVYPVLVRLPSAPVHPGKDGLIHGERPGNKTGNKTGRPAGFYRGKDSQEKIDRCMTCPFPECKKGADDCWYREGKEKPQRRTR